MTGHLINFLKALEAAVPPPPGCHHAITYARYGSDAAGWEDRLALQVGVHTPEGSLVGGSTKFHCFFLEDEDLCGPVDTAIVQIVISLNKPDPDAQVSDTATRYRP